MRIFPNETQDQEYIGNRMFPGMDNQFPAGQGFFFDNMATAARFTNMRFYGNFLAVDHPNGVFVQQADSSEWIGNTIVYDLNVTPVQSGGVYYENQDGGASDMADATLIDNVFMSLTMSSMTAYTALNNDLSLDHLNLATYTALFANPLFGADLTIDNWDTAYAPKASGALDVADHEVAMGAVQPSGYPAWFDYDNRTYDLPHKEDGFTPSMSDVVDQATSSAVATSFQLSGMSTTGGLITITGGNAMTWEIRASDNTTVVEGSLTDTDRRVVYNSQYVHIADATSASNSTATNIVVTVGTESDTWTHTTVAA